MGGGACSQFCLLPLAVKRHACPLVYAVNQFGLLVGFLYLTLSLLLFFLLPLPLFLLFLKECGMERHDFRWRVNSRHSSSSS